MVKLPCKDCPDRHTACHDTCSKYKAAKDESYEEYKWMKQKNSSPISTRMLEFMVKQGKWGKDRQV